ncbi:hypothetical protein P691DRAFT_765609 [Macrolepiota fuliginosa MF-IS2]|uniref:Uncharacterized protein n=1 Tax=Macrolepiota fuliginosa MF-IS2 TaxID=1400762 RepID=A0A9P6BVQ8_9AGAR|nr:hypothetical protein P691DRAFT_765609 [Macrolepiota fuliginosa MF-IS2]
MARKKKTSNATPAVFTLSDATCRYLNTMKQDLCMKSIIQLKHLKTVPITLQVAILDDLSVMGFNLPTGDKPDPTPTPAMSDDCTIYQMWPKVEPLNLSN